MPYIKKERRKELQEEFLAIPKDVGELNYYLTSIILDYLPDKPRYKDYNEVLGVLEACKLEYYRRAVAIYENKSIKKNGDVY